MGLAGHTPDPRSHLLWSTFLKIFKVPVFELGELGAIAGQQATLCNAGIYLHHLYCCFYGLLRDSKKREGGRNSVSHKMGIVTIILPH